MIYGSVALALVVVYRATGLLNAAQGEMATVSAYVALVLHTPATPALAGTGLAAVLVPWFPWPLWASVLASCAAGAFLGAAVEWLVIRRVAERSDLAVISATVAILLVLNGLSERVWHPVMRGFPPMFPNRPADFAGVGGARLRYTTIGTLITIVSVLALLLAVLRYTKLGLAFRAVSSNRASSVLSGIKVGQIMTLGWAMSGAIGGLAAAMVAPTVLLEPSMMVRVLIFSLVAATLGGLDSLGGALIGGVLVGFAQTMIGGYVEFIGSALSLPGALLAMVGVLLWRPSGLFGSRRIERV